MNDRDRIERALRAERYGTRRADQRWALALVLIALAVLVASWAPDACASDPGTGAPVDPGPVGLTEAEAWWRRRGWSEGFLAGSIMGAVVAALWAVAYYRSDVRPYIRAMGDRLRRRGEG